MTEDERDEIIKNALAAEYKGIWDWEPTPINDPFGPDDQIRIKRFAKRVDAMRESCVQALHHLPDEELEKIRDFERKPTEISSWPWHKVLPDSPSRLMDYIPPKWAYGFGQARR